MDNSQNKQEFAQYTRKLKKKDQAYHLEGNYAHFIVNHIAIKEYKQELMKILNISSKDIKSLQSQEYGDIIKSVSDYPILPRPYSSIATQIIKSEDPKNPYNVITKVPEFMKKLYGLLQYGVDLQPIGKDTIYVHTHNRYIHSLDTACNIEIIMRRNGFSERDIIKAIIAGCLHDIATPVFGDLTMKAFPELKEEAGFSIYMKYYPKISKYIQKKFDVSLEEIQSRIKNEGTIGKILDIADRLAYTARDVSSVNTSILAGEEETENIFEKSINQIIQKDPFLFDIMMEISVQDDQVIFENPERLKNILLLRANMHNLIYLNPYLWTREEYFGLILKYLVQEGLLSLEQLQKGFFKDHMAINEFSLLQDIQKDNIIDHNPLMTYDFFDVDIYDNKEQAIARMQELKQISHPNIPVHYLKTPPFKPGTHYLVRDNGAIKSLSEAIDPLELKQLQILSQSTNRYLVLYPKKQYHNNHEKHPKLYEFLCNKANESYEDLLRA